MKRRKTRIKGRPALQIAIPGRGVETFLDQRPGSLGYGYAVALGGRAYKDPQIVSWVTAWSISLGITPHRPADMSQAVLDALENMV